MLRTSWFAIAPFLLLGLSTPALSGCGTTLASLSSPPGYAPGPSSPWLPPSGFAAPEPLPSPPPQLPPGLSMKTLESGGEVSLADAVAIALANNPATRDAWLQAEVAAANVAGAKVAYLPDVSGDVRGEIEHQAALGGKFKYTQKVIDPGLTLTYLLFDFGGRAARVQQAERTLAAADFTQNQTIQDVILAAEQAYLSYVAEEALVTAEGDAVKAAVAAVDAAKARAKAGLGTRADVLQAKTALANAKLDYETVAGQLGIVKGSLATAMGLPADVEVRVKVAPPAEPQKLKVKVKTLIDQALADRADLASAREKAFAAQVQIDALKASMKPSLSVSGSVDQVVFLGAPGTSTATDYSVALDVSVPISGAIATLASIAGAKAQAEDLQVQSTLDDERAVQEVWTSYYNLKTAARRTAAAKDLLQSASAASDVALGQYKQGLGTILDVLSAQSALANARGTLIQAQAQWSLALAQLAHDVGALSPENLSSPVAPASAETK